jgi:hypothetical protein
MSLADDLLALAKKKAFTDWKAVVAMPPHAGMCELFLATLLLGERWKK